MSVEQQFVEKSRALLAHGLATDPSSRTLLRVLNTLDPEVDAAAEGVALQSPSPPACKAACDHCCNQVVYCRVVDVIRAGAYIQEKFSQPEIDELKERLYRYERVVAPRLGLDPKDVRTPCPLLRDGLCTIYEARPYRCRAVNSTDASVCKRLKENPQDPTERPETPGYSAAALGEIKGLLQALERIGLGHGAVDFGRALAIALDQPSAIEDFFKGGQAFAPAMLRQPISRRPKMAGKTPHYEAYGPGDEAKGDIQPADLLPHFEFFTEGDTAAALKALTGTHPVNAMRRILSPMLFRSEDEVAFWAEHCRQAVRELAGAQFDPREAFDALCALGTFEIAYQQGDVREILSDLGATLVNRITKPCFPDLANPIVGKRREGKVRVGYISENLTSSNGGSWALGWLQNHGPEIETYAFCLSESPDAFSMRFKTHANRYYHMAGNVPSNARAIKALDLDYLIYTDIGMSGRNYQYATMRLARTQCTAWGHPVTSGLPTIDYYLSSDLMEPSNGQNHYSEKLVRLSNSGLCYPRSKMPGSGMIRSDFGLDDGPLYLSCQNPMKYLPRWDGIYREICERTGRPIVFVEGPLPMEKAMLRERLERAGVRTKWIPGLSGSDFIALIAMADCCLDTPGWNGGNTTIQALTERVPVVTLPGEFMRGRHSLAFNVIAGAPGLIARDTAEYVNLACDLEAQQRALQNLDADALYEDLVPVKALDEFLLSGAAD